MGKAILIVDDDPDICDTAKDILEDAGFQVRAEGTASAALRALTAAPADLAIFDFNLPDSFGVDLALAAKKICPNMTIFLMTGEAHVELGAAKGAIEGVLTKPVNPAHLIDVIRGKVDL